MNLMILGLTFNLLGSIFLGMYILGEKRLKKLESTIKNLPKRLSEKISNQFLNKISQIIISKSKKVQVNLAYAIASILKQKDTKNLNLDVDPKAEKFLNSYILFLFFLLIILYVIFLPILILIYVLISPFRKIQEKLRLKSFFGILGIFMLFLGYLLQLIAL